MDFDTFRMHLYEYTPDEIFYRNYFEARQEGRLNSSDESEYEGCIRKTPYCT